MKLAQANIKSIKQDSNNALTKRVCNYVIDRWSDYDDKKDIFTDVLHYGCQSGTVGFLIYYSDTVAFYERYNNEIIELLSESMARMGLYDFSDIFGDKWDKEDPLIRDNYNRNLLAWFGFEETLRNIGQNSEALEQEI
ncbi:MAG: hypothetical protein PHE93_04655 [Clostridia bacterium]|nr:hypothetical protein [Clostridia bacterium]